MTKNKKFQVSRNGLMVWDDEGRSMILVDPENVLYTDVDSYSFINLSMMAAFIQALKKEDQKKTGKLVPLKKDPKN